MNDDDGDGIYTITIERGVGFSSYYTFANGNCPDYSCKKDIAGQSCDNPDNFNDRLLSAVQQDTVISTCFSICSDDATNCVIISTEELTVDDQLFSVIPTLVETEMYLSFDPTATAEKQVRVFSTVGEMVFENYFEGAQTEAVLMTDRWAAGMYYVHVRIGNRIATKLIVKQ